MESLNNLAERVDRLTAMVEAVVTEHAGAAAEAVARGVQMHAVAAIVVWAALTVGLVWVFLRALRMARGDDAIKDDTGMIVSGAATAVFSGIALLMCIGAAGFDGPQLVLEAIDPVAAIARDVALK